MASDLSKYLIASENTHAREEVLTHRLCYDLKIAAASCGYHLATYYSDVDHDGFDIIFDDRVNVRRIQIKSKKKGGKTSSWAIHKQLLRPFANNQEELGFQVGNDGVEGGLILIEYEVGSDDSVTLSYSFTDIYVINAIALKLFKKSGPVIKTATAIRKALTGGKPKGKIFVKQGVLAKAATPMNLLALLALGSTIKEGWWSRVRALSSEEWGPKNQMLPSVLQSFRDELPAIMKKVCGEPAKKQKKKRKT